MQNEQNKFSPKAFNILQIFHFIISLTKSRDGDFA